MFIRLKSVFKWISLVIVVSSVTGESILLQLKIAKTKTKEKPFDKFYAAYSRVYSLALIIKQKSFQLIKDQGRMLYFRSGIGYNSFL